MRSTFPRFILNDSEPVYQQIGRQLRASILDQTISCGTRLPSAQALARQFKTSVFTVQSALNPLVQDGLLERTPRRGTYVRAHPHQLTSAGIYFGTDFWSHPSMAFYRELYHELIRQLGERGIQHRTWIDSRLAKEQRNPPSDMTTAINNHEIQGLIAGLVHSADMRWLNGLRAPVSMLSASSRPSSVGFDMTALAVQGLQELHRKNCKTVGAIVPFTHPPTTRRNDQPELFRFFPALQKNAKKLGMTVRKSWVITPLKPKTGIDYEAFGYEAFQRFWQQPNRPEGLIVYPDTVVRGVIIAILELGIKIPGELQLVLHRNEGIPVLCPFRASWLVSSVRLAAAALIDQLARQLSTKPVAPVRLPLSISQRAVSD